MYCFFNHFGSKHQLARYYHKPSPNELVIEPFAGGANFSLYYDCTNVKLYDLDDNVCTIWDYLINCSKRDINALPDYIDNIEQLQELTRAEGLLISRWLYVSPVQDVIRKSELKFYKRKIASGFKWLWSRHVKHRILEQKPRIKSWTIDKCSYEDIPNCNAHWFIDPPYRDLKTGKYKHGREGIDYQHLGEWSKSRQGTVTVCEKAGADWLDFKLLRQHTNNNGGRYSEVYWTNKRTELF